jgi:hypothetical protein
MTMTQDRVLRDIVTAKFYGEIQHWVQDKEFMEMLRDEGDFCADLLSYTIKENLKRGRWAIRRLASQLHYDAFA